MEIVDYFDGLMHKRKDAETTWKKFWRYVDDFALGIAKIVHEKIYLSLDGADHHGVQLARHRITAFHAAGIDPFDQKKTGVSQVILGHEPEAVSLSANALGSCDFHRLHFKRPNDEL
jgi:hypothetical protein